MKKIAALLLAAITLASCAKDPAPAPGATSTNYVDTDRPWGDGQAK